MALVGSRMGRCSDDCLIFLIATNTSSVLFHNHAKRYSQRKRLPLLENTNGIYSECSALLLPADCHHSPNHGLDHHPLPGFFHGFGNYSQWSQKKHNQFTEAFLEGIVKKHILSSEISKSSRCDGHDHALKKSPITEVCFTHLGFS